MRLIVRRALRLVIAHGPDFIGRAAERLPYSRFSGLLSVCLRGHEQVTWRGVPLRVDPGEAWGYSLYFFPHQVDHEFEWLVEQCRGAAVFGEIGAHVGLYTLALARLYPALRVVAFEPAAANAATIAAAVEDDDALRDRVTVVPAAVGEKSGTATFSVVPGFNRGIGHIARTTDEGGVEVALVSLAAYFAQRAVPDVLKIDVEGAEVRVLQGMKGLTAVPRAMLIEVHSSVLGAEQAVAVQSELMALLQWWDYKCRFLLHDAEWVETLSPAERWPARVHVAATR